MPSSGAAPSYIEMIDFIAAGSTPRMLRNFALHPKRRSGLPNSFTARKKTA